MKPARILTLLFLFAAFTAAAQGGRDAIEEQKRVIAALEKRIADEERAISKIQEGRAATEERVRRLARQLQRRLHPFFVFHRSSMLRGRKIFLPSDTFSY